MLYSPQTAKDPLQIIDVLGMTLNNIYYIYYIHNTESLHGHKTHKMLWSFEIQTDYQISARWPDLVIVEKKRVPAD